MRDNEIAVAAQGLGKKYYTPQRNMRKRNRVLSHLRNMGILKGQQEADYFWALRDICFEVPQGQILGIIGQNGSGKSTLLKILTGVTPPTTGRAVLKGRIGSLLEVGTGFHPDMSGRENVFMSGTLLGIPKADIRSKFDELVAFAGIEEFIDMPVKRYSSGMYVRLAYAVASMLQSDILILDEVLAVGDLAFQEKARSSMKQIANSGRTILFVSHHVKALATLCQKGIVLDHGNLIYDGDIQSAIQHYLIKHMHMDALGKEVVSQQNIYDFPRLYPVASRVLRHVSLHVADGAPATAFTTGGDMKVRIDYSGMTVPFPYFALCVHNEYGDRVATISSTHGGKPLNAAADGVVECTIKDLRLGEGTYTLMVDYGSCAGSRETFMSLDCVPAAIKFQINLAGFLKGIGLDPFQGAAHRSEWTVSKS